MVANAFPLQTTSLQYKNIMIIPRAKPMPYLIGINI